MALTYEEQNVTVQNFPAVQPVSGPLTDTELRATPVPVTIPTPVPVTQGGSSLATVSNISVGTSSTVLSLSNSAKTRVIVHNETGTLFVKLGLVASSSSYSYRLTANSLVEIDGYTGTITAIKATGTTPVLVTEIGI